MTIRHLEIFSAVCARGSVTQAAEILNMTQPAVSQAIRELEVFYGVKLFQRMNRRLYITDAGRSLQQYADTILSQLEESVHVLRDAEAGGSCRFGVHVTLGETRLAAILTTLRRQVPEVQIRSYVFNSARTEQMILENRLDFAVTDHVTLSPACLAQHLCMEDLCAVCAPAFPAPECLTLAELVDQPLLLRESGSGTRTSFDAVVQTANLSVEPLLESVSTQALTACAEAGLGIAVLPRSLAAGSLARGSLREIDLEDARFFRQYHLVRHRRKYLTAGMQRVIAVIRAELAGAD